MENYSYDYCTIFSIYIFLKIYQQYIHVFTDLLCENGLTNLCRTSQNKKHFNGTPAQPILMAVMLVYRIQNTESLLSTLIVTDHQCYRAIKSLQTTVHSNTIDTYNTGPRITNVIATRRKNFSQRERSFLWKLRCQWPKPPRRAAKTPATQDPGAHVTNAKRPLTKSPQQKARLWLADAKASPNHSQKLPAKSP